jgi:hypothetical protein
MNQTSSRTSRPQPGLDQSAPASSRPSPPANRHATELLKLLAFALQSGVTPEELRTLISSGLQASATCPECLGEMEPCKEGLKCVRCDAVVRRGGLS